MVIVGTESADIWRTAAGYLPFSALKQKLENAPPYWMKKVTHNAMLQLVSESFGSSSSDNFGKIESRAEQAFGVPEESGRDI